ncbi:hypothetical protein B7P43_G17248 [Cryptotermes secundus]|uniref:Uncharacterized protein n=1 Tax=Cryptotermes secundus TaxID=105785 RepID=A0A2J7Q804_9NEOP|nr:hypothetical protein B7P43_G17248 [Cryptotermes secundus]
MDDATPEPCTPRPTPQIFETKKTNRGHKQQQQHPQNTHGSKETIEGKNFTDLESPLSAGATQKYNANNAKRQSNNHKAIDILCDNLKEQDKQPTSINTFPHFIKACRRQKDPKVIAKEHTINTTGLVRTPEENLFQTKDYNLRRRMKRIIESLKP